MAEKQEVDDFPKMYHSEKNHQVLLNFQCKNHTGICHVCEVKGQENSKKNYAKKIYENMGATSFALGFS